MRFASIGSANAGSYVAAGKSVADSSANVFDVQRKTGPDYAGLSKVAMRTASEEKQTAMKTAAEVTQEGIKQLKNKTITQHKIDVFNFKKDQAAKQRKAGGIAAIGKIGAAAVLSRDNTKGRERPKSDIGSFYEKWKTQRDELTKRQDAEMDGLGDFKSDPFKSSNSSTGTGTAGKVTTGGSDTSLSGSGGSGTALTGNSQIVLDAIAGPESGSYGYQAFNQGGSHGGTRVVGKSGNHQEVFGESLTDMTLSEIFRRQNMGGSGSQFRANGGLHAVGRYQFIGSTLQDEVNRMGLDPNTRFTPNIQDQIAISHIKRVGNISPWVGPMTKWSQSEKARINGLIQGL